MLKYLALLLISCIPLSAETSRSCIQFSVVTRDTLKNLKQGLSPDDQKWFREKVGKKNSSVCYVDPAPSVSLVFVIIVTPDTYHGTRVVTNTSTNSNPTNGTITDQDGNTATYSGTQETTSTTSTAVPYSFEYGIYTLSVERQQRDGSYVVLHRFQQRGIYHTLYGIPLGGKGHHPTHAVIEEAAEWINSGGLAQAERFVAQSAVSATSQTIPSPTPVNVPATSNEPMTATPGSAVSILDISSSPAAAEIEIDGAFVGNTPASVEVSPGDHMLTITKNGFVSWERKLKAMPGHVSVSPELQPAESKKPQ
ncbi:MAG: PEGA domain-containing protein [Acidobacteriaceae bacterium]|jgi:hypothetical protein